MVRAGVALYGGNPRSVGTNPMYPVVRLQGRVIQIHCVEQETGVGYGATATVQPPARLATVALGYADGYRRCLGNIAHAIVGGTPAPVLGRISMDTLVLDVSSVPPRKATVGSWATLIGDGVGLDDLAMRAGTISYELLTGIGPRVKRTYI